MKDISLDITQEILDKTQMSEEAIMEVIEKIASKVAWKFTFGYFTYDDIKQEATRLGLEGLRAYKPDSPLENFLRIHIKNRLINFKRKRFIRHEKPCSVCPLKAYIKKGDICTAYQDKMDCSLYSGWIQRNEAKKNIISPVSMDAVGEKGAGDDKFAEAFDNKELILKIDREIPIYMRKLWLQAKGGVKITAEEMRQLKEVILEMFEEDENES